jgi:CheY-like chemotaxis protein
MTKRKAPRVLVAEDNADMRAMIKMVLEEAGYDTQLATDGRRALELQHKHPADVLITDIFMPETDGMETIDRFKSRFPQTRIIAMSGGGEKSRMDYLTIADNLGVNAALRKPFDAKTLLQTLQIVLRR